MRTYQDKAELKNEIDKSFEKYISEFDNIPESLKAVSYTHLDVYKRQMLIFTNEEVLIEIGIRYLKVAGWSYLLTGISQCYLAIMKVSDHAAQTAKISIGAVLINIVLNAVFIFGFFGLPAMGVQGAALATLISRIIELGWAVTVSHQEGYIRPDWSRLFHRDALLAKDFRKCMLPILGASLAWGIGFTSVSYTHLDVYKRQA